MADEDSSDPAFDQSQIQKKETENGSQTNKKRKKRKKKKKKTSIISNSGEGIAAYQIFGDVKQYHIAESSSKKDLIPILQKDLRDKYLEKSCLQNIPGLDKDCFIDDHYVDLKLVQLFEKQNESIETNLEEIFQSLKKTENDCKSGIRFEGELGYGKTTLMWKIARDWANQETYLSDFDLLFVIPLRDLEYSKTVNSFIKEQWFSKFPTDKIWDEIKLQRVLILFDGFDELEEHNRDKILKDIKTCKEKRNFVTVITSRSGNSLPKLEEMISDFQKVSIKGFPEDGVSHFLKRFLGKEMGQMAFKRIEDAMNKNNFVSQLRCNPLFLTFFCIIIKGDRHYALPNTYTDLIKDFICSLVQRHIKKKTKKQIEISKINLLNKDQNPQIVKNFIEELEHFGEYAYNKLISNNIGIWVSFKEIQDHSLNSTLEIGLIVQSYRIKNRNDIYEPIHLFILEFLRSYHLYCLFLKNKKEFYKKFQELLVNINSYFGIKIMISFIFGLLGKHLVDVIQEIPSKLFFGQASSLLRYMQTENPEHFKEVYCFLESFNNRDVSFEINISNHSSKPNFNVLSGPNIRPLMGFVDVHHGEKIDIPHSIILYEFPDTYYEIISINFHCIKGKTCLSEDCCISEVFDSLKELLEKKPQSITIRTHCHFTGNSMIKFLSENSEFESLILNFSSQESLNMELLSNLLLYSKVKKLNFNNCRIVDSKINVGANNPFLKCLLNPASELKHLEFNDVDVQIDFKYLLRAVKQSKLISFSLQYSSFQDNVSIDMSQLLRKKSHLLSLIDLQNVHVIARVLHEFHLSKLCLCNCKMGKKAIQQILKKGSIEMLEVDMILFMQRQKILLAFQYLGLCVVCQMDDYWESKENKTKLVSILKEFFFLRGNYEIFFIMNSKSNIYLQQITTITECLECALNNFYQPHKIPLHLQIVKPTEQRKIEIKEIYQLSEVIAKLLNVPEGFFNCDFHIYTQLENRGHYTLMMFKLQQRLSNSIFFSTYSATSQYLGIFKLLNIEKSK